MIEFHQIGGELLIAGKHVAFGYSGYHEGVGNPAFQRVANVGPIPCGEWTIVGKPFDHANHGPFCMRLEPCPGTDTFGRSGFLIHGDSASHPGQASRGCIILPRFAREEIWHSGEKKLVVRS